VSELEEEQSVAPSRLRRLLLLLKVSVQARAGRALLVRVPRQKVRWRVGPSPFIFIDYIVSSLERGREHNNADV
jgi:hypothetical protein